MLDFFDDSWILLDAKCADDVRVIVYQDTNDYVIKRIYPRDSGDEVSILRGTLAQCMREAMRQIVIPVDDNLKVNVALTQPANKGCEQIPEFRYTIRDGWIAIDENRD